MTRARNVMSRRVHTVRSDERLSDACQVMIEEDCGAVPVVDVCRGTLVGIVTDRDACLSALERGTSLAAIPVCVAMTADVVTCREEDELCDVLRLMQQGRVRRLPVLDEAGRLVGMLSLGDVARASMEGSGTALRVQVAETLADVSAPRDPMLHIEPAEAAARPS